MFTGNVRQFIKTQGLISQGDSVLVAVSGGADSVALLHVLSDLRRDEGLTIEAAHLNHGIRAGTADDDAAFVEGMCRGLGIRCYVEKIDTPSFARNAKLSLEEAARELRYRFLKDGARKGNHNKIALGHTMNDQAETVLMHLIRGAGLLGASGMKPMSEAGTEPIGKLSTKNIGDARATPIQSGSTIFFIRPFLATTRAEIEEFLASKEIPYREDASNLDTTLMRNRVRHELMELLKRKYNPRIVEVLGSHASLVTEAENYLSTVASEAYRHCLREETGENIELELTRVLSYHTCVQSYVFREAYRRLCGSLKDLGFTHVACLVNLVSSGQSGDSIDIASGISALLDGQSLWIGRTSALRSEDTGAPKFLVQFEPGQEVRLTDIGLRVNSKLLSRDAQEDKFGEDKLGKDDFLKSGPDRVFFDLEKLKRPLVLRNLEPGDRMAPFGMDGTKKIQDLLVDLKIPRSRRRKLAAFCDRNQVLWLVGIRRSSAAPVTGDTRLILSVGVNYL